MKKFITIITLSILCVNIYANDMIELSKTITKTYDLPASKVAAASNSYGNITVIVGSGSQIKYDIHIKAKADSKSKAQDELDRVTISFSDSPSRVLADTNIGEKGWFNWSWSGNTELEVKYTIYVPDNRSLDLSQNYGNIYLPNYNGPVKLDVAYGNINTADLNNSLTADLDYGNAKFGCIKNAKLSADYSDLTINSATDVTLDLQYGDLDVIESVSSLTLSADYSDVNIASAGKLSVTGDYSHFKVTSLGSGKVSNDYGDIEISNLKGNFSVDSDYHTTKIGNLGIGVKEVRCNGDYSSLKLMSTDGYTYTVSGSYLNVKSQGTSESDNDDDDNDLVKGVKKGRSTSTQIIVKGDYVNVNLK